MSRRLNIPLIFDNKKTLANYEGEEKNSEYNSSNISKAFKSSLSFLHERKEFSLKAVWEVAQ